MGGTLHQSLSGRYYASFGLLCNTGPSQQLLSFYIQRGGKAAFLRLYLLTFYAACGDVITFYFTILNHIVVVII